MKTLQEKRDDFIKRIVPEHATDEQKNDMAMAFTVGFAEAIASSVECESDKDWEGLVADIESNLQAIADSTTESDHFSG